MRQISLHFRMTLLVGLLSAVTLLLFALSFYVLLQTTLLAAVNTRLSERAALASAVLAHSQHDLDQSGPLLAPEPLTEFNAPGIYVEVIGPDNAVRAASPNLADGTLPKNPALLEQARENQPAIGEMTVGADEQLRLLITPLATGAPPGTVLLVAESLEPLQRTMEQTRSLLIVVGGVTLLIIIVGVALLTGYALRPVERLTAATSRIADTQRYDERAPPAPYTDEVGRLTIAVNVLIATVERTLAQQRQLLADTSHELRSPLTVVLANLDLLRRNLDEAERDQSLREATVETQRMRRLVNDLLLLAQSDAGQAIERASVQLDQLAATTIATVARQHASHQFRAELAPNLVILGDAERLTQLLRNLLENAVRHTPPGTQVTVALERSEGQAVLRVADTGPGIPPADLPQIWDRFYRVDKARSRSQGGSGLGLAIVKFLAEAHGGYVAVESTPGCGSTFSITLPLAPA
ncbi:MAG: ATP-binding protein [Chloroflexales bacterium]